MSAVDDLMYGIAQIEGFGVQGSIAARNNNPGNLRWAKNQIGQEKTVNGLFATFATEQEGWDALREYIYNNQNLTLRDFVYKYAPPNENNTEGYISFISGKTGLGPDDSLQSLFSDTVNIGGDIASSEGFRIDTESLMIISGAILVGLLATKV